MRQKNLLLHYELQNWAAAAPAINKKNTYDLWT